MNFSKKIAVLACITAMSGTMLAGCGNNSNSNTGGNSTNNSSGEKAVDEKNENAEDSKENKNDIISIDDISTELGIGWNYGNTLEANSGGTPSETVWGNPEASQKMIDAVADAGFSTVRVPVSYLSKIDDENGYKVDEAWLDRVQEVVDYCYNKDLNVIINVHGDGYNSITGGWLLCNGDNQNYIKEKYEALWKQIAEKFATYDEHLIFESMNEEFDGEYHDPIKEYYENINAYNQIFVDTVRSTGENNTHRWLLVPGWNTDIDYTVGDYGFELPTDENNTAGEGRVIVSVHYYAPWDYCGEENDKIFLWGARGQEIVEVNKANPKNKSSWGEEDFVEQQFDKLKESFLDKGYPVIIGEFGAINKMTANEGIPNQILENRAYYLGYVAGKSAEYGIIPVYWDNGYNGKYGFGLFDRNSCEQTQPEIIKTMVEAWNNKNPEQGLDTKIKSAKAEKAEALHAYIGIQTDVYTFRNAYSDNAYGHDSEYFNTLIKWEDTDGDGKDDIVDTGAVFSDAEIKQDGNYEVSVSGYDFSGDTDSLNMLFVSTDFKYSSDIKVKDCVLYCDDTEIPIEKPVVMEDNSGNFYIEIVNIYNSELQKFDYTMPKDSFKISFNIEGTDKLLK